MSDFSQDGLICTLQYLSNTNRAELETRLDARARPITIVLPCHARDLAGPALVNILDEIGRAQFVSEVILTMNGLDKAGFSEALRLVAGLPQPSRVLWNDGPRMLGIWADAATAGLRPVNPGKGFNVWTAAGLIQARGRPGVVVTQDCDVLSYRSEMSLRLCSAVADTELDYDCAKACYSRVKDRIYGRASRLFLAPLLRALLRVVGHHPFLDFLLSFRYPLSGEWAATTELLSALPMYGGWGFEIGMLYELFHNTDPRKISQVDPGGEYDHAHQPIHGEGGRGLAPMAKDIATTLFFHLSREGVFIDASFIHAVHLSYEAEARWALKRYKDLARINSLSFDDASEQQAVEAFAKSLPNPDDLCLSESALPSWNSIAISHPCLADELTRAVDADQCLAA